MENFLLHDLLKSAAVSMPERIALVFFDREVTYSELDHASDALAGFLVRSGVKIGDRVAILLSKSPEAIISVFGILKAGAAYVPIDPQLPAGRATFIIENCGIRTLVTSSDHFRKQIPRIETERIKGLRFIFVDQPASREDWPEGAVLWSEIFAQAALGFLPVHMADVSLAYILYTSGSTGTPKGVAISHANALAFVNMANRYFSIKADDRFASHAPLHFDLSVFDIYVAMKSGATIVLFPEYLSAFPIRLAEYMHDKRISVWNSAASVLVLLAEKGKIDRFPFENLRLVHFSGDVMPSRYLELLRRLMPKAEFFNIYGQTEANSSLCFRVGELLGSGGERIPIGKPFPNFEVFAVDDHGQVISSPGLEGELYVKSSTVALGYWRDLKLTGEKFVADPRDPDSWTRVYRTGDIVRMDEDGNYYFVGRKDHMIKSRGYRIEIQEIERILTNHPLVGRVAVVGLPDELIGNRIVAFVSVTEGSRLNSQELAAFCAAYLPKYMIPEIFEVLSSLPMTSSGKIDRTALARQALARYGR